MNRFSSLHTSRFTIFGLVVLAVVAGMLAISVSKSSSLVAISATAATPSSGTLTDVTTVQTYDAGPFLQANQSPVGLGQVDQGPRCDSGSFPCDNYTLTISLPPGYLAAHPNASVKVTMFWTDTGSGQSDYDLYIYRGVVGDLDGSTAADYQAASGANPEVGSISPLLNGSNQYSIKVVPYTPSGETVHVRMELLSGSGDAGFPGFGGPDPTSPGAPRYQNFFAPAGSSAEASNGEFNIGFNPATKRIMVMNSGPIWRLTPAERLLQAKPECCPALWEDVTNVSTITGVDPILWTDQKTGRTFASNSTAGTNGVYGYSDDDGETWNPLSASPPNASSDHQTIGSGPYPAALAALITPVNQGEAVYYCAQTFPVGAAACQRSDTLGLTYGPSTLPYDGTTPATDGTSVCRGIHGHVRVAPDGTVYLPVRNCSGNAGVAVSTDGGLTWVTRIVPNTKTQTHGSDPSVAIGANNTVYFFYVRSQQATPQDPLEGHIHVQVSTNRGVTWSKDTDLGATHGIKNAVFPEAVAGDDNRAAVGFLGTDRPGDFEGASFPGIWYPFVATTFDGGDHWTIVNVSPNDPVQGVAGIWLGGGSNTNRNLLDFNEITLDDKGRVLFGYNDGCVGDCIGDPTHNSYGARMRVARQFGGKSLFASYDPNTDTTVAKVPKPACLSGTRDPLASHLSWVVPDNGGANITNYQIFRGTSPGGEVLIGQTGGPHTAYHDTTANPAVAHYYYVVKAINAAGTGSQSNEIDLTVTPLPPVQTPCNVPGLTKLTDPAGDTSAALGVVSTPAPPGSDLLAFHLAQPFAADGVIKLRFTIDTDNGQPSQPPGSAWYVAMKIADPAPATTFHYKGVHMAFNGSTPTFESYTPGANNSGGVDGRFVEPGSQVPADAASSYAAPYNQVIIVVKASDLGLNPGDTIGGFVSGVSQSTDPGATVGAGATSLYDQMPDSLGFAGSYTVNANTFCTTGTPTPTPTPTPTVSPTPAATTVQFSNSNFGVVEGVTAVSITVTRSGPVTGVSTVDYTVNNSSATQRGDFTYASGTVVFSANETSKSFQVLISEDSYGEGTETATVTLSNAIGATIGAPDTATIQINDNEAVDGSTNAIDDAATFVGMHYHDFLNRQADSGGQTFWTNQITACGNNANCLDEKRNNVSAAFFLSVEFQNTGYFAFRFYRASFPDNMQRPRGVPRYLEFLRDEQKLQNGVVVGQANWEVVLEQNKQGFTLDWIDRADFIAEYPTTLTRDEFIDKLFTRSGATATNQERTQAQQAYDSGFSLKEKRALGIRAVIETGSVYNAQYNPAFVLMQYFGYLRRNPNNAPDNAFTGYDFWLNKMNQFSVAGEDMRDGNVALARVKRAEMVKAFLVSGEYRGRFGGDASRGGQAGSIAQAKPSVIWSSEGIARAVWFAVDSVGLRSAFL